jgi:hypothetical protein
MGYTLQDFAADTRSALKTDAGRKGLAKVRAMMERLVKDERFVSEYFHAGMNRGLCKIYTDPELGFELMTYRWDEARGSQPHDHGDSWAIYAQVSEYTDMTEYERTDDGKSRERAALKVKRQYRLNPGQAGIYFGRELHSTSTPVGARYLRITGTDLENIERLRIDAATGKIEHIHGRQVSQTSA